MRSPVSSRPVPVTARGRRACCRCRPSPGTPCGPWLSAISHGSTVGATDWRQPRPPGWQTSPGRREADAVTLDTGPASCARSLDSLRERLQELSGPDGAALPRQAKKTAFVFSGDVGFCRAAVEGLYESEPVVRAVLGRCDAVVREARGQSLIRLLAGPEAQADDPDDAGLARSGVYALQCALAALWSSVGIRPDVVAGHESGELAAAQAAGVFDLEDGLRLALAGCGASSEATEDVILKRPAIPMVNAATGSVSSSRFAFDESFWRSGATDAEAPEACAKTLADLEVDVIVDVGLSDSLGETIAGQWPASGSDAAPGPGPGPLVLLGRELLTGSNGFVSAVAGAYEAGLPVSFPGLFAGETRRRVALPIYPFERTRHWIEPRKR